jgi:hypothetical protein
VTGAVDALERALRDGLDVDADPPRGSVPVGTGELLVMPSSQGAVKLVTVGGDPRIRRWTWSAATPRPLLRTMT